MIFNIFKSKPTLKDLIPEGFVDIHSHILPGIDDGAKNIEESKRLIYKMKKIGFSKIIGTPHTYTGLFDNTNVSIKNSFNKLKQSKIEDIEIDYASEYMIESSLIKKIENKNLLTLKNNYVLIEMSYISKPNKLYDILFLLITNNYIPILAHPERYRFFFEDIKNFYELKNIGCLFQINLLSVIGYYGKDVKNYCNKLLKNNLIDFTGSDIHNIHHIECFEKKVLIDQIEKVKKANQNNIEFFS